MATNTPFEVGDILETVFIRFETDELGAAFSYDDSLMIELVDFCIDPNGLVRKGSGIIGTHDPDDPEFVPPVAYHLNPHPWNAHDVYVELELPNPATETRLFYVVRTAMFKELKRRLAVIKERLAQEQA